MEGQAESAAALGVAVGDTAVKRWVALDAEVEHGIMSEPGAGGGVVQAGWVGGEQGGFEHWSGLCVRGAVGGGEEQ